MDENRHIRGSQAQQTKLLPPGTVMRFATAAGSTGAFEHLDGMGEHWPRLPFIGDVLTLPFLVRPGTREPVPVRVIDIIEMLDRNPPTIAVVVGLAH